MADDKQGRVLVALYPWYVYKPTPLCFSLRQLLNVSSWILGRPLSVSVAYSGRISVAYKSGKSFRAKPNRNAPLDNSSDARFFNLVVSIFECESTGGEWYL